MNANAVAQKRQRALKKRAYGCRARPLLRDDVSLRARLLDLTHTRRRSEQKVAQPRDAGRKFTMLPSKPCHPAEDVEIAEAAAESLLDYQWHSNAGLAIAREVFEAEKVLRSLLDHAGI